MADRDEFLSGKWQAQILDLMGQATLDEIIHALSKVEEAAVDEPSAPDPFNDALQLTVLNYARGEYQECIDRVLSVREYGVSFELAQLLFLSAERAGREDVIRDHSRFFLAAFADQAWYYGLLTATLKKTSPKGLVAPPKNPEEKCQYRFYAGMTLAREGKAKAAKKEFAACVKTGAPCLEFALAQIEDKRL